MKADRVNEWLVAGLAHGKHWAGRRLLTQDESLEARRGEGMIYTYGIGTLRGPDIYSAGGPEAINELVKAEVASAATEMARFMDGFVIEGGRIGVGAGPGVLDQDGHVFYRSPGTDTLEARFFVYWARLDADDKVFCLVVDKVCGVCGEDKPFADFEEPRECRDCLHIRLDEED